MRTKECIAMILAGGQGSRLGVLTQDVAKPAVPFAGKYRLIDFPLSNCVNSGLDTVGVLTQYQPLELNTYVGSGAPWDLDRLEGGVYVLPPFMRGAVGEWYKGTANAIYQNMNFIEQYQPEFVLVLGGDHIYKMQYQAMLDFHKKNNADCTIAVIEVPWEEAGRFGIINAQPDGVIYEFDEKPQKPKSNLASMGIYIFRWALLKRYLEADDMLPTSSNDFGKDVLPAMLGDRCSMYAYPFEGYWKDVGTLESLWDANMDVLEGRLQLRDQQWRIYSRNLALPPQFIAETADIDTSSISEGCTVRGTVKRSVLFSGVVVEEGAEVVDSIVMPNARVGRGTCVHHAIIGEQVRVGDNCGIGVDDPNVPLPESEYCGSSLVVLANQVHVENNIRIAPRVMVDRNLSDADIVTAGHDVPVNTHKEAKVQAIAK